MTEQWDTTSTYTASPEREFSIPLFVLVFTLTVLAVSLLAWEILN